MKNIEVIVPSQDFQEPDFLLYTMGQGVLEAGIQRRGLEMGISLVLSGVGRELRRHMTLEEVQELFRKFADTMPEAAQWDR